MIVRAEKVAKMLEKALDGLPVLNDDGEIYCAEAIVAERLGLTRRQATATSYTIDLSTQALRDMWEFWQGFRRGQEIYIKEVLENARKKLKDKKHTVVRRANKTGL